MEVNNLIYKQAGKEAQITTGWTLLINGATMWLVRCIVVEKENLTVPATVLWLFILFLKP